MAFFSDTTIVLAGLNHKTAPLALRERLALSDGYEAALNTLAKLSCLREYALLSTCNRVEILFVCRKAEAQARTAVLAALFGHKADLSELEPHIYAYEGREAVLHLFQVAASLDSLVVGEAQILGQIKAAYRAAAKAHGTKLILNRLMHKAFFVAKRVRTETRVGASAVSISYAAVELGRKIFGELTGKKALLIGAGEMAELAAEHLLAHGAASVTVANRTLEHAVELARRFHGAAVTLAEIPEQLSQADVIISSTGAPDLILRQDEVRRAMRGRKNRPLFFIDIAVPRDLDPAINELDNAYLYDIDDLKGLIDTNRADRAREAVKAGRIIEEEALKFDCWLEHLASTPTIVQLKAHIENIVRAEVAKTASRTGASCESEALERLTQAITGKLLYHPLHYLKAEKHGPSLEERIRTVRDIFTLDKLPPENSPK